MTSGGVTHGRGHARQGQRVLGRRGGDALEARHAQHNGVGDRTISDLERVVQVRLIVRIAWN